MRRRLGRLMVAGGAVLAVLLAGLVLGCQGEPGPAGTPGAPGTSSGTLNGVVTNPLNAQPVDGVSVTFNPAAKPAVNTNATGNYAAELPIGSYTVTYAKPGFTSGTQTVVVVAGQTVSRNVALQPAQKVVVNAGADVASTPGSSVTLNATANPLDNSTVSGYRWKQTSGPDAEIEGDTGASLKVTLADAGEYRDHFLEELGRQNRWIVQSINPHELEEGEIASFEVVVTTSSGTFKDSVSVSVPLGYAWSQGLNNVAVGVPVLLNGKDQPKYQWTLAGPTGTTATLSNADTRNPSFTPDVGGRYMATEKTSSANVTLFAGTWVGGVTGVSANGQVVMAGCTACHDGKAAPNKQFEGWKASGHAQIFTQNITTRANYGESCMVCHVVGLDKTAKNNGFDDASDFTAFMASNLVVTPAPNNYTQMLSQFPQSGKYTNIQCENCHGPNDGNGLHPNNTFDKSRISVSSDVCGTCHGEPPRHGRFQQWEATRHAGSSTTPARGVNNASCGRCHSAQGFLAWIKQADLTKQIQGANGNATAAEMTAMGMGADTIEAVTCVACHDPHQQGTVSSDPTDATVRIVDETRLLPAGFQASVVGKGALCMTCHNTRNALHTDLGPPLTSFSAPHTASQADVLMGENAFFVSAGQRSPHSLIKDTCVTCHMEATPPPEGYTQTGTNHSFAATLAICGDCHSKALNGEALQAGVHEKIEEMEHAMGAYMLRKLASTVTVKDYTPHAFSGKEYDVLSNAIVLNKDNIAELVPTEPHGQQGFIIHLKQPMAVTYAPAGETAHTMQLSELEVRLGDFTTDGTKAVLAFTDPLVRAGWNFFLIEGDGSFGVHNPAFTMEVIEASIEALR